MIMLTLIFYGSIILAILVSQIMIVGCIVLPIYLGLAYIMDDTTEYVYNKQSNEEIFETLMVARNSKPHLKMVITTYKIHGRGLQGDQIHER